MSLYRDVLRRALAIAWRNKILWPFGFLAGLLGAGGSYEILFKGLNLSEAQKPFIAVLWHDIVNTGLNWGDVGNLLSQAPWQALAIVAMIVVVLAIFAALFWAVVVANIVVVRGVDAVSRGESSRGLIHGSAKYFWPTAGISVLGKIVIAILFFILASPVLAPLLNDSASSVGLIGYLVAYVAIFIISLFIAAIMIFAVFEVVLDGQSFGSALRQAWHKVADHWLICLETSLILLFTILLFGLLIIVAVLLLTIPVNLLFYFIFYIKSVVLFWAVLTVGLLATIVGVFLLSGFLWTYQLAVWTLLYDKIKDGSAVSKLERLGQAALTRQ